MPSCARPAATPIISCSRMPTLITRCGCRGAGAGLLEGVVADVGEHDREPWVAVERLRGDAREALAHGLHGHSSTSATTACGLPGTPAAMARSSASWSLASAVAVDQPSPAKRVVDAGGPAVGRAVVVDDHGHQPVEAEPARERDGLVVGALCELAVAEHAEHARLCPAERPQPERAAHGDRQPVAERAARDLDAGDQRAVGVVTERRVEAPEAGQRLDRHEALGGEHGVVRSGPVPLGEQAGGHAPGRRRSRA